MPAARSTAPPAALAADILLARSVERRLRTLNVAKARTERCERIGAPRGLGVAHSVRELARRILDGEIRDHVVLVDAVARHADCAGELAAAIDRDAAGEDLQAVAQLRDSAVARTGSREPRRHATAAAFGKISAERAQELVRDEVELQSHVERAPLGDG